LSSTGALALQHKFYVDAKNTHEPELPTSGAGKQYQGVREDHCGKHESAIQPDEVPSANEVRA
jgi:hypothetical protein